ncbi:MAG TPA: hypothetical protein VNA67_03715 [Pseudonocardiaceae bacterium]|nr:hypothetical protein [Pseudonocardiaceae bacterium]
MLDLQLVGVEQHRRGRQCSQPPAGTVAQQQIDRHGNAQAEQVLHDCHRAQPAQRQHDVEDQVVADRA